MEGEEVKDDSYKYVYYVHYIGENRRLDEWVERDQIMITNTLVEDGYEQKKGIEKMKEDGKENEEHEGMDPNSIRQHEELTKFKTIERIVIGRHECEVWYYSPYPLSHQ